MKPRGSLADGILLRRYLFDEVASHSGRERQYRFETNPKHDCQNDSDVIASCDKNREYSLFCVLWKSRMSTIAPSEVPESSLPTAFSKETCIRRGLCPVSTLLHERLFSHSIYYEQHGVPGTDPIKGAKHKMLFIMGLNVSCFAWGPQVRYFGKGVGRGQFTALVFDNRGVGNSGYPRGPYS
jgi:hypothetical protein